MRDLVERPRKPGNRVVCSPSRLRPPESVAGKLSTTATCPALPGFDLRRALCNSSGKPLKTKVLSLQELAKRAEEIRRQKRKLVLTNGCFDLLHIGHVRYLEQARELGDFLAVAVNGDQSVRALKGHGRPIIPEGERAEVLAALESVDFVTIFAQERATEVIEAVRPAIYVKGGDYARESLNSEELAALKQIGAEIRILPLVPGKSTSRLLQDLCRPNE